MLHVVFDKGIYDKGTFTLMFTGEKFELNQWLSLKYFVYLVGLHQVENYYTKVDTSKKISKKK